MRELRGGGVRGLLRNGGSSAGNVPVNLGLLMLSMPFAVGVHTIETLW